jgi:hypothetical protein
VVAEQQSLPLAAAPVTPSTAAAFRSLQLSAAMPSFNSRSHRHPHLTITPRSGVSLRARCQDDAADHAKWARAFPTMQRVMHERELGGWTGLSRGDAEVWLKDAAATRRLPCNGTPGEQRRRTMLCCCAPALRSQASLALCPAHAALSVLLPEVCLHLLRERPVAVEARCAQRARTGSQCAARMCIMGAACVRFTRAHIQRCSYVQS